MCGVPLSRWCRLHTSFTWGSSNQACRRSTTRHDVSHHFLPPALAAVSELEELLGYAQCDIEATAEQAACKLAAAESSLSILAQRHAALVVKHQKAQESILAMQQQLDQLEQAGHPGLQAVAAATAATLKQQLAQAEQRGRQQGMQDAHAADTAKLKRQLAEAEQRGRQQGRQEAALELRLSQMEQFGKQQKEKQQQEQQTERQQAEEAAEEGRAGQQQAAWLDAAALQMTQWAAVAQGVLLKAAVAVGVAAVVGVYAKLMLGGEAEADKAPAVPVAPAVVATKAAPLPAAVAPPVAASSWAAPKLVAPVPAAKPAAAVVARKVFTPAPAAQPAAVVAAAKPAAPVPAPALKPATVVVPAAVAVAPVLAPQPAAAKLAVEAAPAAAVKAAVVEDEAFELAAAEEVPVVKAESWAGAAAAGCCPLCALFFAGSICAKLEGGGRRYHLSFES
jgi:hypothetical protein